MKNRIKNYLNNKKGMSLVEVLTAMTILSLAIFCFAPLFLTYLQSITIAGGRINEINQHSATMQTVIGLNDRAGEYTTEVGNIPLSLQADSGTTISRKGRGGNTLGKSFSATLGKLDGSNDEASLDGFKGNLLVSDNNATKDDIKNTFITVTGNSQGSGLSYYPSSLTDDFQKATITLISDGSLTFGSSKDDFDSSKIKISVSNVGDLKEKEDYEIKWIDKAVILITFYGGGSVCFENSPLTIKYGGYDCVVEIDAPMMIMVGEKAPDDNYYYYVSRGELEELDGKNHLLIHRRTMNTTNDPRDSSVNSNSPTTLTAAMNDVEWVPADSADHYTQDSSGKKYGYYVMCGDHGQVRRFWKNPTTGNYYWGGDYTYYTDYNLNRFGEQTYIKTKALDGVEDKADRNYSTDTSFKYVAMRPMFWLEGESDFKNRFRTGFNMSSKKYVWGIANTGTAHLRNLCTVSATYGDVVEFFGSDGQLFPYVTNDMTQEVNPNYNPNDCDDNNDNQYIDVDLGSLTNKTPSYDNIVKWQTSGGDSYERRTVIATSELGLKQYTKEAWGWLDPGDGTLSYYRINGLTDSDNKVTVDTKSYPITLTSVDAICINGTGGVYESNVESTSQSHYFSGGVISATDTSGDATKGSNSSNSGSTKSNLTYPMSNYVLYCGYIPAYMDAWASTTGNSAQYPYSIKFAGTGKNEYDKGQYATVWNSDASANIDISGFSNIGRASNRTKLSDNAEYNSMWRMTMGITPFHTGSDLLWNKDADMGYIGYQIRDGVKTTTVVYYPYTNLSYAITGKYYDRATYNQSRDEINSLFPGTSKGLTVASPDLLSSHVNDRQYNTTAGKVVDITISYLSHPLAISISANPTDDEVFDYSNNKEGGQVFYWHNRREAITFLDSASTVVPSVDANDNPVDIPVSLMVGYVLGGTVFYGKEAGNASVDVTSVMNNGIVFLRAGGYKADKHDSNNAETGEYKATDTTGYKLNQESNVFHQFYYLDSNTTSSEKPEKDKHVGDIYGANYWQNNQHIIPRSITGPAPTTGNDDKSTEYLRAHPMSDTKVTCVAWGVTWDGKPEAMWGTENGTVLSWDIDTIAAKNATKQKEHDQYNDRTVDAEIQSYRWIDTIENKKFYTVEKGSGLIPKFETKTKVDAGEFSVGASNYFGFYDKGSRDKGKTSEYGFINTLENINDIEFANDIWIAAGDQGGVGSTNENSVFPNEYCATGAYTGDGDEGSWINVRYWADTAGTGKQSSSNNTYYWKAVQISGQPNCNIVQINNLNGMWIATGYIDGSNNGKYNDEYDEGEQACIFWTYDPLAPCGAEGGWSSDVLLYDGKNRVAGGLSKMGGINSCATRTVD